MAQMMGGIDYGWVDKWMCERWMDTMSEWMVDENIDGGGVHG